MPSRLSSLGEPQLTFHGLRLWVHGFESASAADYWDGNWLRVTADLRAPGSHVTAAGSFLRTDELYGWLESLRTLNASLAGSANLEPLEPTLKVAVEARTRGAIAVTVWLTPDQLTQRHSVDFESDQSYLPPVLSALAALCEAFPVKGKL